LTVKVETKWFVNRMNNGDPALLFQTSWLEGFIQKDIVWNKSNSRWQESRIIHEHCLKPNLNIDEVTHKYAYGLFPEAVQQFRFILHDEDMPGTTLQNREQ